MKTDIHPHYYQNATITCACGNSLTVGSTVESAALELCSACHPFYTGKQKLMDVAGRLERFQKRVSKKVTAQAQRKGRAAKNKVRATKKADREVKTEK